MSGLECTCGIDQRPTLHDDTNNSQQTQQNNSKKLNVDNSEATEQSDVDTDSLESLPNFPTSLEVKLDDASPRNEFTSQNELTNSADTASLKSLSGSSFSDSRYSPVSFDHKMTQKSPTSPLQNNRKGLNLNGNVKRSSISDKTTKTLKKTKTFDSGNVKANSKPTKQSVHDPLSVKDRRMSESSIQQTWSESHGIRETLLSRSRFEKCHENHDGFDCEGNDYLTPTQRKDILLKDLRKEIKELKKMIIDKTQELDMEKENFEKKLEMILAEKGTEIVILKSDIETLEKKNEELQKSNQVSVNTVNMLEENIRDLKESMANKEKNSEHVFLETYRKGQMSALFERNEELERMAVSCDGSRITIKELIQKLLLTEAELGKWQSIRRQESYDGAPKPETEADATLRFLKDSFFHYITDSKDSDFHLRAIIRILSFTDVQKKKIADSIVAKRKNKQAPL